MTVTATGKFVRVNHRNPCPVCKREKWCMVSEDGAVVLCMHVRSDHPAKNGKGWIHHPAATAWKRRTPGTPGPVPKLTSDELQVLHDARRQRCIIDDVLRLANRIKVSTESLEKLGIGFDGFAYTFPMYDGHGRIIGIQRRLPNNEK